MLNTANYSISMTFGRKQPTKPPPPKPDSKAFYEERAKTARSIGEKLGLAGLMGGPVYLATDYRWVGTVTTIALMVSLINLASSSILKQIAKDMN